MTLMLGDIPIGIDSSIPVLVQHIIVRQPFCSADVPPTLGTIIHPHGRHRPPLATLTPHRSRTPLLRDAMP
jgi:hypothetical protein